MNPCDPEKELAAVCLAAFDHRAKCLGFRLRDRWLACRKIIHCGWHASCEFAALECETLVFHVLKTSVLFFCVFEICTGSELLKDDCPFLIAVFRVYFIYYLYGLIATWLVIRMALWCVCVGGGGATKICIIKYYLLFYYMAV